MKTRFSKTPSIKHLLLGTSLVAASLFAGQAVAGTIVGSPHDFSSSGFSGGEICIACHTPHNADTSVADAPLWNHTLTTLTYDVYSSATLDAGTPGQPGASSRLCLSCHDGTVALDSFGGNAGSIFLTGSEAVGRPTPGSGANGDLSDDHPISITFDTALSTLDPGLFNPSTTNVTIGQGGTRTRTGTIAEVMLVGNQLQCASCHDVHNTFTVPGSNGSPLLKVSRAGSALCLTCHNR